MNGIIREAESFACLTHASALLEQQKLLSGDSLAQKLTISPEPEADSGTSASAAAGSAVVPLAERLDKGSVSEAEATLLVDFPPNFRIAPFKPAVFDLAFNAVQYPSIRHRIKEQPKPKSAGILSRLGSLVWGGGKS